MTKKKAHQAPLVSIIMPVYNGEKYISESINSVLNQTYTNFELIVINDGSTDDSEQIIQTFKDDRIIYLKNITNIKLITTLNIGLRNASGEFIARLDSDDIMLPNRIAEQVSFFTNNSDYGLIGTYAREFGESIDLVAYPISDQELRYACIFINPFVHSSVMFRKSILFDNQLEYNSFMLHVEDYELWVRMLRFTKVANIPEVLVKYRVHQKQISNVYQTQQIESSKIIQRNYLKSIGLSDEESEILTKLFYGEQLDFKILYRLLMLEKSHFDLKLDHTHSKRLLEYIYTKTRDAILLLENIKFNACIKILFTRNNMTIKQKTVFFLRSIKNIKNY